MKIYTLYSDYFCFWTNWLHKYFNEMPLGEAIESAYRIWKSEQNKLTPKYDILCLLVSLLKQYFVTMVDYLNQLKITYQWHHGFATCKVIS